MNFFFKFVDGPRKEWEGPRFADTIGDLLESANHSRYQRTRDPKNADVVCLVESVEFKNWRYLEVLSREPELQRRPDRCFAINYEPDAVGFLSGCYTGIPKFRFDPKRHRATGYLIPPNDLIEPFWLRQGEFEPEYLLSFRGAVSHVLREGIFQRKNEWREYGPIQHIDRWFDHTEKEKFDYFEEILKSKFVLCPRGISPPSHRLFEVMQLGRVPVIIADAWVPPEGPEWEKFSIRVNEADLAGIPQLLKEKESEIAEMGALARAEWERWFSPQRKLVVAAEAIESLLNLRPESHDERKDLLKWKTLRRHWEMGWTLPQRVGRRIGLQ